MNQCFQDPSGYRHYAIGNPPYDYSPAAIRAAVSRNAAIAAFETLKQRSINLDPVYKQRQIVSDMAAEEFRREHTASSSLEIPSPSYSWPSIAEETEEPENLQPDCKKPRSDPHSWGDVSGDVCSLISNDEEFDFLSMPLLGAPDCESTPIRRFPDAFAAGREIETPFSGPPAPPMDKQRPWYTADMSYPSCCPSVMGHATPAIYGNPMPMQVYDPAMQHSYPDTELSRTAGYREPSERSEGIHSASAGMQFTKTATQLQQPVTQLHSSGTQLHANTTPLHQPVTPLHQPVTSLHASATPLHPFVAPLHQTVTPLYASVTPLYQAAAPVHPRVTQLRPPATQLPPPVTPLPPATKPSTPEAARVTSAAPSRSVTRMPFTYTEKQIIELEREFVQDPFCPRGRKQSLGVKWKLEPEAVLCFFRNSRTKMRRRLKRETLATVPYRTPSHPAELLFEEQTRAHATGSPPSAAPSGVSLPPLTPLIIPQIDLSGTVSPALSDICNIRCSQKAESMPEMLPSCQDMLLARADCLPNNAADTAVYASSPSLHTPYVTSIQPIRPSANHNAHDFHL